jgi:hypothetical protein
LSEPSRHVGNQTSVELPPCAELAAFSETSLLLCTLSILANLNTHYLSSLVNLNTQQKGTSHFWYSHSHVVSADGLAALSEPSRHVGNQTSVELPPCAELVSFSEPSLLLVSIASSLWGLWLLLPGEGAL